LIKSLALTLLFGSLTLSTAFAETLAVGAYPANPPWEYKNEQGQFEGFEVDLVNAIAKKLGDEVEFQDLGFTALFAATSSGRVDMAISSITITEERLKNQAFTQGYYDSDLALLTQKTGKADLEAMKGEVAGAISSSVGEAWIKANQEKYGFSDAKFYNDQQSLLLDLQAGRIGGAVGDILGFEFALKQMTDLTLRDRIKTGDRFGIMLPKTSKRLEEVNQAITDLKKDGTLASIHKKWLGTDPDPQTSTLTVLDIPVSK
jgi:polar amino acid transport system substrate-binding protein